MFSILIPTWNNLAFVKLCVEGIRNNSSVRHQVILHINEGADGTLDWAKQNEIEFTYSEKNVGICMAVNQASGLARNKYIIYMNDDMYPLPYWDKVLMDEIELLDTDCFMLSSTMIEPYDTGNHCVVVADYGRTASDFNRAKLLTDYTRLKRGDWYGSTWPPTAVHRKWWDAAEGYSEEFSPGMSSDNDFAMKMWQAGCRLYKGCGSSLVYHFISKSTGKVVKNNGRKQFLKKWGIKQSTFDKYYIHRGEKYNGPLAEPGSNPGLLLQKIIGGVQRWVN